MRFEGKHMGEQERDRFNCVDAINNVLALNGGPVSDASPFSVNTQEKMRCQNGKTNKPNIRDLLLPLYCSNNISI